jgi:hypothetical protein
LATIELHMGVIEQFRSKVNSTPKKGLVDMLNGVRSDLGWRTPEEYMADRKALSDAYLARPRQP